MKKILLLLAVFIGFGFAASAQDKIYKKGGDIIKCKIVEIGTDEIKYIPSDNLEGPTYNIEKDKILKLVFANGKTEVYSVASWKDPEAYQDQLRKAIKIDFTGPLLGYTQFSFEKVTKIGQSYELSLGIIGAGKNQRVDYYYNNVVLEKRSQFGGFIGAGYKFNKLPDFLFGKTRMSHIMQGGYAKPALYLGHYGEDMIAYKGNNDYVVERQKVNFAALQLEFGKQWVFGEKFLIDLYWGFGYGFDNKKTDSDLYLDENTTAYNYVNARVGRSPGLSFNFGIKAGLLIK